MKQAFFFCFIFYSFALRAEVHMRTVDPSLFIHLPQTDFDLITVQNEGLKRSMVEFLFTKDLIDHIGTKAYDPAAKFDKYYQQFAPLYRLIDLNADKIPELVFNGYVAEGDDREHLEIYQTIKGETKRIYNEVGNLIAYKIHPNTKEVLLFHHQYPCCVNASHNLNRLRFIQGKITLIKRYFLGTETGMVGPFFPKKSIFSGKFKHFQQKTALYWSPAVVEKDAWYQRSPINRICFYDSAAVYTVLAKEKKWSFVLVHSAPNLEPNRVINPTNFKDISIFGWIQTQ